MDITALPSKGLYALKPAYARILDPVLSALTDRAVRPNAVSLAGVGFAAAAGLTLAVGAPGLITGLAVGALAAARLACANLDGGLARRTGVYSRFGGLGNELGDRLGDLLLLAGFATHVTSTWLLGMLLAASAPSWIALTIAAQGGHRRNGGPVGKTERCALAAVAAATGWFTPVAVAIAAGSAATALVRLSAARTDLPVAGAR